MLMGFDGTPMRSSVSHKESRSTFGTAFLVSAKDMKGYVSAKILFRSRIFLTIFARDHRRCVSSNFSMRDKSAPKSSQMMRKMHPSLPCSHGVLLRVVEQPDFFNVCQNPGTNNSRENAADDGKEANHPVLVQPKHADDRNADLRPSNS